MRRKFELGIGAGLAAFAIFGLGVSAAGAVPAPDRGPAAGGTTVVDELPSAVFTAIDAGDLASYAIDSEGRAYAWGENWHGQLGIGSRDPQAVAHSVPAQIEFPDGIRVAQISGGWGHAAAIDTNGDIWTWGMNRSGQLGLGDLVDKHVPVKVEVEGKKFVSVAAGIDATWAIDTDAHLWGWGSSSKSSPLGDGTVPLEQEDHPIPLPLAAPADVTFTKVSTGRDAPAALSADGRVWVWGSRSNNRIPAPLDGITPQPIPGLSGVTALSAGVSHIGALTEAQKVLSWGDNYLGSFGDGTNTSGSTPQALVQTQTGPITAVSVGFQQTLGINAQGTVFAWGSNEEAALGNPEITGQSVNQPVAVGLPAGLKFKQVAAGTGRHGLALSDSGKIYAWGQNNYGQAGVEPVMPERLVRTPVALSAAPSDLSVSFGGVPGNDVTVHDDGTWSAVTPGGCGPVDVTVNYTIFGAERSTTYPAGFTYGEAAAFLSQPVGAEVAKGERFTAEVEVSGDPAPTVQWEHSATGEGDWAPIGAPGAALDQPITETAFYRAVATNCFGPVTSEIAKVTLKSEPEVVPEEPTPTPGKPTPTPEKPLANSGADSIAPLLAGGAAVLLAGATLAGAAIARRRVTR